MVEGQASKEVEPRLPGLPNGWLSFQSRKSLIYVILAQDNNGGDLDLLSIGEIRPRHQIKSNGLEVVRCKVMETLDLWMTSLGEPRLWIRV